MKTKGSKWKYVFLFLLIDLIKRLEGLKHNMTREKADSQFIKSEQLTTINNANKKS